MSPTLASLDLDLFRRPSMGQEPITASPDEGGPIEAVAVSRPYGRLGNNFYQMLNAALVARALGLRRVIAPEGMAGIDPNASAQFDDLLIAPGDDGAAAGRLAGSFYVPFGCEEAVLALAPERVEALVRSACDDLYASALARAEPATPIAVAFRAGDVFVAGPDTPIAYTQPPAAYYLKAIAHALAREPYVEIDLVYQDRANPAIGLVEQALERRRVRFRSHPAGMEENFVRLLAARTVVSCPSTFAEAAALVSRTLRFIYSFRDHCSQGEFKPFLQSRVAAILGARGVRAFLVDDVSRTYTNKWQWAASREQVHAIGAFDIADLRLFESL